MKETKTTEDKFFREIMSKSRLILPYSDFEDNVMMQIEPKVLHQNTLSKELRLSWIFFIVGSVFGIIFSVFISQLRDPIFGIQPVNLTLFFAIVFASVLFTQIDTLIKFSRRVNSRGEYRL
jgi:nicotinamide riboside transporter PnuC